MHELKNIETPTSPMMPMLPELFANAMPVPMPQMEWQTGFIKDFVHNWKLKRIEKASEREANIAEHKTRYVKANLDALRSLMTFSAETEMVFKRLDHEKKRMEMEIYTAALAGQEAQADIKLKEAEVQLKMVKVQIAEAERDKIFMENEVVKKNLEKILNAP